MDSISERCIADTEVKVTIHGALEIHECDYYIPGTVVFEEGSSLLLQGTSSFNCDRVITCKGFSIMSMNIKKVEAKVANTELNNRAATEQQEIVQSLAVTEKNVAETKKASTLIVPQIDNKPVMQADLVCDSSTEQQECVTDPVVSSNAGFNPVVQEEIAKEQSENIIAQEEKKDSDLHKNISVSSEKSAHEEVNEEEEEIREEDKEASSLRVISDKKEESIKENLSVAGEEQAEEEQLEADPYQYDMANSGQFFHGEDFIVAEKEQSEEHTNNVKIILSNETSASQEKVYEEVVNQNIFSVLKEPVQQNETVSVAKEKSEEILNEVKYEEISK